MDNHKKLFIAALVVTVIATGASASAYLSSVSPSSKAATREDINKIVQQLRSQQTAPIKSPLTANLTVDKPVIRAAGATNLKTSAASVDKSQLHVSYTNTTGSDLKGARLFIRVSGKSQFALGSPAGATAVKNGPKLKPGYVAYTLPDLKAGQTAEVNVPFIARSAGSAMKVTALLQAPGTKITSTQPVTLNVN